MTYVVRVFSSGVDAIFSPDGTRLYSGSDVIDVATGGYVGSSGVPSDGYGRDITPDGRYLISAGPATRLSVSGNTSSWSLSVYQTDLVTGQTVTRNTSFIGNATAAFVNFYDVLALSNGTALLTQGGTVAQANPSSVLDLATGTFTQSQHQTGAFGTFTSAAVHAATLYSGLTDSALTVLDQNGTVQAVHLAGGDGVVGSNTKAQAMSVAADKVLQGIVMSDGTERLIQYDTHLNYVGDILPALRQAMGRGSLASLVFNSDGSRLYGLNPGDQVVYEFDTTTWQVTHSWALGLKALGSGYAGAFGDAMTISSDDRHLSVLDYGSVILIDLAQSNEIRGGVGDDVLTGGAGPSVIYGLDGSDRLSSGANGDTLVGGAGDDTYIVDTVSRSNPPVIIERPEGGNDLIITSVDLTAPDNVETLQLAAGAVATLSANGAGMRLVGNDLGTEFRGGAGNDVIMAGRGDDIIYGNYYVAADYDTAIINARLSETSIGFDVPFRFPDRYTDIVLNGPDGRDTLYGIERIQFLDGAISPDNAFKAANAVLAFTGRQATTSQLATFSTALPDGSSAGQIGVAVRNALLIHVPDQIGDFNGDGRDDIYWRQDTGKATDWLGRADGGFVSNDAGNIALYDRGFVSAVGDFNGDGRADLFTGGSTTSYRSADTTQHYFVRSGQPSGGFADGSRTFDVPGSWHVAGAGDVNGDGRDDLIWRNDSGAFTDWLSQADGSFLSNDAKAYTQAIPVSWHIAGVGDFDGDGRDDIVWRNDSGAFTTWSAQPEGGFVSNDANAFTSAIPLSWRIAGVGDFNGDGRADILWRNDSGALTDWLAQAGGGFVSNDAHAFTTAIPNRWQIAGVGDFNGDGRSDILWRNESGTLTNWLGQADGGFVSNDIHAFDASIPNSWQIAGSGLFDFY